MNKKTDNQGIVLDIIKLIPFGKVATYGQISNYLRVHNKVNIHPRVVGRILHSNPDPEKIACHRVVYADGKLSSSFAFGGYNGHKQRLSAEGVKLDSKGRIDLKKHLWRP